jgi:hypothetical protein
MQTRLQSKQKNRMKYNDNRIKYNNNKLRYYEWISGKEVFNFFENENGVKYNNLNINVLDRCNGDIYKYNNKKFLYYRNKYTCATTRSMTQCTRALHFRQTTYKKYIRLLNEKKTRSNVKKSNIFYKKYFTPNIPEYIKNNTFILVLIDELNKDIKSNFNQFN